MSQCCETDLDCPCPPVGLIDVVGKKWAVCVIALLGKHGVVRFGPIQRCLSGVSPATLTTTLRALERARLVERPPAASVRGQVRAYGLTPAGQVLYERLRPLADWLRAAAPGSAQNAQVRVATRTGAAPPPSPTRPRRSATARIARTSTGPIS